MNDGKTTPLVAVSGLEVIFPSMGDEKINSHHSVLALKRHTITLEDIISKELIYCSHATTAEELFHEVLERVVTLYPQISKDELYTDLIDWSHSKYIGIGNAVAIPYCYCWDIDNPLCVIIRLSQGINFHVFDGKPVRLFFILLIPSKDPKQHMALQSDIAHLVAQDKVRDALLSAQKSEEIVTIIKTMA